VAHLLLKRFVRVSRISNVRLPGPPHLSNPKRLKFDSTLKDIKIVQLGKAAALLMCFALAISVRAGVQEVGAVGLTVGDLNRELEFYTNTLPFKLISISEKRGKDQGALLGLDGVK